MSLFLNGNGRMDIVLDCIQYVRTEADAGYIVSNE